VWVLSGTRALRWLPTKMPGREPMTSEPSNTQSTDPRSQWPTPAIKVSGTAWAMSEPTSRAIGGARVEQNESRHPDGAGTDRGERHEHGEQEPGEGRSVAVHHGSGSACRVAVSRRSHRCDRMQTAVMTRAMPKAVVIRGGDALPLSASRTFGARSLGNFTNASAGFRDGVVGGAGPYIMSSNVRSSFPAHPPEREPIRRSHQAQPVERSTSMIICADRPRQW
jgi:hypothetical protein